MDFFPVPVSALTGHTDAVEHTIDTGNSTPIHCSPRRMSSQKIKQEETCVAEMLAGGQAIAVVSTGGAGAGGTRFCVDYRRFTPYLESMIPWTCWPPVAGKRWFSTLDLASGYWQVSPQSARLPLPLTRDTFSSRSCRSKG